MRVLGPNDDRRIVSLEAYNLITSALPVGGWIFRQQYDNIDNGEIVLKGNSATELLQNVRTFRQTHNIPIGDLEGEIAHCVGNASPENVKLGLELVPINQNKAMPYVTPIERLRKWFAEIIPKRLKFCDAEEAARRAAICEACAMNQKWRVTGCSDCNKDIDHRARVFLAGVSVTNEEPLHWCRAHDFDLRCGVHIDVDELPAKGDKAPPTCWINISKQNGLH